MSQFVKTDTPKADHGGDNLDLGSYEYPPPPVKNGLEAYHEG
jgi:hypothetical protein